MLKVDNLILIKEISEIPRYFEELGKEVWNTVELNNVILTFKNVKKPDVAPPTPVDEEERNWLYENIDFAIKKLSDNINSRQAIIYNTHDSGLDHNCINTLHLYYRENKLHMNVYVRSMNYNANFENDMYTFDMILTKACNELMLDKGQVVVFIMSLHQMKNRL
jgi:thymidylate synthase